MTPPTPRAASADADLLLAANGPALGDLQSCQRERPAVLTGRPYVVHFRLGETAQRGLTLQDSDNGTADWRDRVTTAFLAWWFAPVDVALERHIMHNVLNETVDDYAPWALRDLENFLDRHGWLTYGEDDDEIGITVDDVTAALRRRFADPAVPK